MNLSIVIPVRDDYPALSALLTELRALRERGAEVIVVDASPAAASGTAHPPAPARGSADVWLVSPPGRARQLHAGASAATRDLLWFLHADSSQVADCADWLLERETVEGQWGRFDVALDDEALMLRVVAWFMNWRSRLTSICTGDQGIWMHRELLAAVGGWPQQALMEDIEICVRLRRLRKPLLPAPGAPVLVTSARRWRQHGTVRTILLMWQLRLRYALGADPEALYARYYS